MNSFLVSSVFGKSKSSLESIKLDFVSRFPTSFKPSRKQTVWPSSRSLPPYHKDPFDRMLVAQAKVEKLCLVSSDEMISKYPIEVVW